MSPANSPPANSPPANSPPSRLDRYEIRSSRNLVSANQQSDGRATSPWIICIAIILLLGLLYVASSLWIPLAIALIAYLTLRPVVAKLCHLGLGQTPAAAVIIIGLFSIIAVIATVLYSPLQTWLAEAPESVLRLRQKVTQVAEPLTTVDRAGDQLDRATAPVSGLPARNMTVAVEKPSLINPSYLINQTGHLLAFIGAIGVLTFFMLCGGDDVLNRVLTVMPDEKKRSEVLAAIGDIQDNVGRYLGQITMINIGLGVAITIVMWLVGMPTPYLWGVMATLLNFVPYIGPIGGTLIVFVAAGSVFDSFWRALMIAAAFWLTTAVEGQFVTPTILGKTLKVGSLVVLVAVAFWGFMWGLPGILLSVPLLIVMREVCSCFDATYPLAVVLGEDPCRPGQECEPVKEDEPIAKAV
ncbi:AI-2 transport protein TqsA [Rubripirellula obstinata]|uniref:AI-2 transport protein TqsA n=2 Tax=Rubripirellula obstinata TaxID=406547 RepID=A0A5B1CFY5_9BACT|nr:AI-2E family transporter [Rubripirellula obstinata]KAA1258649.1 AI-2 transport protein TqsA [Rubripirellula obstinata]